MLHIMKFDEAISCTFVRNLMEFWIIKIFHVKSIDQELNYAIKLRLLPSFHKTCFARTIKTGVILKFRLLGGAVQIISNAKILKNEGQKTLIFSQLSVKTILSGANEYSTLIKNICLCHKKYLNMSTYRDPGLLEVEPHGERLAHEDVRVVAGEEGALQLLQLPLAEVGPGPPPLGLLVILWGLGKY